MSLSGQTRLPNCVAVLGQRPIFDALRVRRRRPGSRRAGNQPEQPELEREAGIDRFLRRRLAGLVVDDRQPAVGQPVDAVGFAVENDAGDLGLAADLGLRAAGGLRAIGSRSCSSIQLIASISRGAHSARSIGWMVSPASSARRARQQRVGRAIVLRQPILEHLVDRGALPRARYGRRRPASSVRRPSIACA